MKSWLFFLDKNQGFVQQRHVPKGKWFDRFEKKLNHVVSERAERCPEWSYALATGDKVTWLVICSHVNTFVLPVPAQRPGKPQRQTWAALRHSQAMLKMYAYFPKQASIKESTSVLSPPFYENYCASSVCLSFNFEILCSNNSR